MTQDALMQARLAYARRDFPQVLALLQPLTRAAGCTEPVLAMAANAALLCERYPEAVDLLLRLRRLQPGNAGYARITAQAYNRIGVRARRQGQNAAAENALTAALEHDPEHPEALFNLAALHSERGLHGPALPLWRRLHALTPADHDVGRELAICLGQNGQTSTAAEVLAGIPLPEQALPRLLHARAMAWAGAADGIPGLLAQLPLQSDHSRLLFQLAEELEQAGDTETATAVYDRLVAVLDEGRRAPGMRALYKRHLLLAPVSNDPYSCGRQLERYALGLERLGTGFQQLMDDPRCQRRLSQLASDNFFLAYQHSDGRRDRLLQARLGSLLARAASRFAPSWYRPAPVRPNRAGGRRARIGLVSSHWRLCTVGSYFGSWVGMLADAGHDVQLFQVGPLSDDLTHALAERAQQVHILSGSLEEMASEVADSQCDLLIYPELGMDRRLLPLAALRLAPRQACAWGHPVTTGLPTIDAWFTCADMEPTGAADFYTETLLPLPGLGTDYHRPTLPEPVDRRTLGLPEKARLYLVPHAPYKLHVDSDAVWASIAAADPEAVLVLFRGASPALAGPLQARLGRALTAAGADPQRQLLMLSMVDRSRFLQITQACDVMVDTVHWSGGNSTIDALLCGLPVLTCEGAVMRARQSAAMLRRVELPELIVDDASQLASAAVTLAQDTSRQQALSRHIREHLPALFDATGVAQALTAHVDRLLHDWPDRADATG